MSEAWPTSVIASRCDFRLQKNFSDFQSPITRTVQRLDRPGRRYVARYTFRGVGQAYGQAMSARINRGDTFLMWDMRRERPLNGVLSGVLVNGAHLRGNTTIAVDGLPISQTRLLAGDYVGIGSKLYELESDVLANGSGEGSLLLSRGLLADVADNTAVNTDRPTCEMMLETDDAGSAPMDPGGLYVFDLSFIEAL